LLGVAVLSGCDDAPPVAENPSESLTEIGGDFDPATAGTLNGRVIWDGAVPDVAPYRATLTPSGIHAAEERHLWPNPNAPKIDLRSKAVAQAVVFLRGVDPRKAAPWNHAPVRVELRDYQIHVFQGEREEKSAFLRRGDSMTMVSLQDAFHSLQVRGASFFTRAFPDAEQPCRQRFDRAGVIELMSGCGYFWMRGYVFVADHPYFTHTDSNGHFVLPQVPPGQYELVCWLPDWHEAGHERDADTGNLCRLTYRSPVEVVQPIRIAPGQTQTVRFLLPAKRFGR
jgi:hypothetical protein